MVLRVSARDGLKRQPESSSKASGSQWPFFRSHRSSILFVLDLMPKRRTRHPSDSTEHRDAEPLLRRLLSEHLQAELGQQCLYVGGQASVQVDAVNMQKRILCEIYARIGKLKVRSARRLQLTF